VKTYRPIASSVVESNAKPCLIWNGVDAGYD
jgi:hypothetical protein